MRVSKYHFFFFLIQGVYITVKSFTHNPKKTLWKTAFVNHVAEEENAVILYLYVRKGQYIESSLSPLPLNPKLS